MKIGLSGSSMNNKDNLSGSASPIVGFMKELLKHGHSVVWLEKNPDRTAVKFSPVPVINTPTKNIHKLPKTLDLDLLIIQTWCHSPHTLAKAFSKHGTKVYYWDDNTPFAIERTLKTIPYVDTVLSHGEGAAEILRQHGVPRSKIEVFYFATDPVRFKTEPSIKHKSNVVFVGTNIKERNSSLKEMFFTPSLKLKDYQFKLYGSNWDRWKQLNNFPVEFCGWIKNEDLHKAFSNATISINATRRTFRRVVCVPSNRVFDIMASGTVLLTDPIPGIEKMFKVGKDLLIANSANDAINKIKDILNNPTKARFIRNNAREAILLKHCWKHRVQQLGLNK